jgi:hypothetical protein
VAYYRVTFTVTLEMRNSQKVKCRDSSSHLMAVKTRAGRSVLHSVLQVRISAPKFSGHSEGQLLNSFIFMFVPRTVPTELCTSSVAVIDWYTGSEPLFPPMHPGLLIPALWLPAWRYAPVVFLTEWL